MVCKQFKNSDYKKGDELDNCYMIKKFYSGNLTEAQREIFVAIRHYPLCMNNIKSQALKSTNCIDITMDTDKTAVYARSSF